MTCLVRRLSISKAHCNKTWGQFGAQTARHRMACHKRTMHVAAVLQDLDCSAAAIT